MPMPEGFDPTTGFPEGHVPETTRGCRVVRVGCAGGGGWDDDGWESFEKPRLSEAAVRILRLDMALWGDCYLTLETGERVCPADVRVMTDGA